MAIVTKFVNREQLRFRSHGRKFRIPDHLPGLLSMFPEIVAPASFDLSMVAGKRLVYPLDGNDQLGDCYYAACAHGSQTYTGNAGIECAFDVAALKARYLKIAGGDNGLDDQTMMPEWKGGIVGPHGAHNILDEMTVSFANRQSWLESLWACGGMIWTASLIPHWVDIAAPNALWDATGRGNPNYGHAMYLTGKRADGTTDTQTWGLQPSIHVTDAGFLASDSEFIVAFSKDQFKANGICAFSGMTWEQKRAWWKSRGGIDVGPSPFVPVPPPPPPPPVVGTFNVTISIDPKTHKIVQVS